MNWLSKAVYSITAPLSKRGQPAFLPPSIAMVHLDKDPTLRTLLEQEALAARGFYTGPLDNWRGPRHEDALQGYQALINSQLGTVDEEPAEPVTGHRRIYAPGLDLIKHFESCFLTAYADPVGIWTIGWGHTGLRHNDGSVRKGRVITQAEADALLRLDMDFFEADVQRLITAPLADHEFAALVSFHFNTGGLGDSTLRRLLNSGDRSAAAEQFLRWDKAGGRTLKGLTRRRKSERRMFLGIEPAIVAA